MVKGENLPTNKISDYVCVAYKNGIRIAILIRFRAMKIFSKCCLYSGPILKELEYRSNRDIELLCIAREFYNTNN